MADPYIDPYLAALAANQSLYRQEYDTKSDTANLADPMSFLKAIGYDPIDYQNPAQVAVEQFINEAGLPVVTVNGQPAWVGESAARSYYEGSSEDDEYAALALQAMDFIDEGTSPRDARRYAADMVNAVQAGGATPELVEKYGEDFALDVNLSIEKGAFQADPESADKVFSDIDGYGRDLNTRQGVVDRAEMQGSAEAEQYGAFQGGGPASSGLGADPFGYEEAGAPLDPEELRAALQGDQTFMGERAAKRRREESAFDQTAASLNPLGTAMANAPRPERATTGGTPVLSAGASPADMAAYLVSQAQGQGAAGGETAEAPRAPSLSGVGATRNEGPGRPTKAVGTRLGADRGSAGIFNAPITDDEVGTVAEGIMRGNLPSRDPGVVSVARRAWEGALTPPRPNAGHQELIRRVMAERVRRGMQPLPEGPGPNTIKTRSSGERPQRPQNKAEKQYDAWRKRNKK